MAPEAAWDKTAPIILVDDDEFYLAMSRRCYETSTAENPLITCLSGEEFIALMDQVEAGTHPFPALVLLDINMPKLNGFDVLGEIRQRARFRKVPPIVMLTGSDNPSDMERALGSGANDYKVKPDSIQGYIEFFNSLAA